MAIKSAYKPKSPADPPAPAPEVKIDDQKVEPSETVRVFSDEADPAAVDILAVDTATPTDEATLALQKQLAALRASEQAQRDYAAAQMAAAQAPAPTLPEGREERIALWRQHGLSDDDAAFLQQRPDMVDNPMLTRAAFAATMQAGIERNSPDFGPTMEAHFDALMGRAEAQAQAQAAAANPATQPTPAFFAPRSAPSPTPPDRSGMYSAPVSRTAPSGATGQRLSNRIELTPEEAEYARIAGISDVEYARQKQKLAQYKAAGEYPDRDRR